jgi:hypothetical protein
MNIWTQWVINSFLGHRQLTFSKETFFCSYVWPWIFSNASLLNSTVANLLPTYFDSTFVKFLKCSLYVNPNVDIHSLNDSFFGNIVIYASYFPHVATFFSSFTTYFTFNSTAFTSVLTSVLTYFFGDSVFFVSTVFVASFFVSSFFSSYFFGYSFFG